MVTHAPFTYEANDGTEIVASKWFQEQGQKPKAIVQIAHGYAEHRMRYEAFAGQLAEQNIFVYGNDHRGHGETGQKSGSSLYFADQEGFDEVVRDMKMLTEKIKEDYPDTPIILFGHSMGSFLARRYISLFGSQLDGIILCGTGWFSGPPVKLAKWIAAAGMKTKGPKYPSKLLSKLVFGNLNKSFEPGRTSLDWLSRNEQEVDKFIKDPLRGSIAPFGFFYDYLHSLDQVNRIGSIKKVPADLPVFIISGAHDPVGGADAKGVLKTFHAFKKAGVQNVRIKLYEEARHELLNELNKDEVQKDILDWISACISK